VMCSEVANGHSSQRWTESEFSRPSTSLLIRGHVLRVG
jgi:hypothetical protein